jgi:hypothetical protein
VSDPEKTILFELRDSARESRNEHYRKLARQAADSLTAAINIVWSTPTRTNMVQLNDLWSVAERLLQNQPTDDPERGGQVRVESTEKVRTAA